MKPLSEALEQILSSAQKATEIVELPLLDAYGRYLAQDIIAAVNVPPADNSAMDGYAINTTDFTDTSDWIPISQTINAGSISAQLTANSAARIFTGAEIPEGANTVVIQENCQRSEDGLSVRVNELVADKNIRRRGQDIAAGDCLFSAGHRLASVDIGVLASQGFATVNVNRKIKVAIVSTGDELVEPGQPLTTGKIYNSNRYLLHSALTQLGCEVLDLGKAPDNLAAIKEHFNRGAIADLIISTGGVSVGEADFVKQAVAELGEIHTWKLAIKPGKPLAFGRVGTTPFIGLPGNPVAVFVTFILAVKPFIKALNGNNTTQLSRPFATDFAIDKKSDRANYLRVKITNDGKIQRFSNQSSGVLSSVAWADALAIVPEGSTVEIGNHLQVILLNDHILN